MESVFIEEVGYKCLWDFHRGPPRETEERRKLIAAVVDADYHFRLISVDSTERFFISKSPYGARMHDTPMHEYLKENFPSVSVTPFGLTFNDRDMVMLRMTFS